MDLVQDNCSSATCTEKMLPNLDFRMKQIKQFIDNYTHGSQDYTGSSTEEVSYN
jgi:hypothetical protein